MISQVVEQRKQENQELQELLDVDTTRSTKPSWRDVSISIVLLFQGVERQEERSWKLVGKFYMHF